MNLDFFKKKIALKRDAYLKTGTYLSERILYYQTLCNAITIYCVSPNLLGKGQIGYLDIIEHSHLYFVKKYINSRKI